VVLERVAPSELLVHQAPDLWRHEHDAAVTGFRAAHVQPEASMLPFRKIHVAPLQPEHFIEAPAVLVIERHRHGQVWARIARAGALDELAPHGLVLFTLKKATPRRRFRQPTRSHLETGVE
jgi:hypothetical protein